MARPSFVDSSNNLRDNEDVKKQAVFIANWKMHGRKASLIAWIEALAQSRSTQTAIRILCPPAVYLDAAQTLIQQTQATLHLGAQNVFFEPQGAYTGEIAAAMLRELGCRYVLIGHSERRNFFQEPEAWISKKLKAALEADLIPILCVGESAQARKANLTEQVIQQQLAQAFSGLATMTSGQLMIAYEPVWAIGTGLSASPEQAQRVQAGIRAWLKARAPSLAAVPLLYGGSVNTENASALMREPDIDGLLMGGASLNADDFLRISGQVLEG